MHAIRLKGHGGPEALELEELPTPAPGPGQVLVRLEAAGVNFIDVYRRSGLYKVPLPHGMGLEGAGVVEACGPGVSELTPGLRVAWTGVAGSYASHALVPAAEAIVVPPPLDGRTAAAAMLQGMTAHYLSHSTYPLKAGESCLVHAGAGGVGLLLTQMAKQRGARVLTTVSTGEKAQLSQEAGADATILYSREDFPAAVRRLTGGAGVQVVYDSVGKDTFEKSLDCLAPRGMLVLYGQSSGPVAPVDPQVLNAKGSLFLTRPTLFHYTASRDELLSRAQDVLGAIQAGRLRVRIGGTFPLARAADAHRELEARRTTGKLLLIP
jgi:NADPH2:quinone reductase